MSETINLEIESLAFDKKNPRLPKSVRDDDKEILKYLATKTGIERLMSSIGKNGFFPGEAVVVVKHEESDKYTVIEGNRRLAALQLLQDPTQISRASISKVANEADHKPSTVPAYVAPSREDTLQYLGFRHISGVQRWDPLAKARYLESLYDLNKGEPEQRYSDVALEIGSFNTTVRRNLDALAAYRIVEQKGFYDLENLDETTFRFGTFYTAVSNTDIANFIGTRHDGSPMHPIEKPDVIIEAHLKELVKWMFEKDAQGDTKLGESRNIGKLGSVIADSDSLLALREGQSLEAAYRSTGRGRDDFMRHLNQAIDELKQANANLHSVERDDERAKVLVKEALKIIQVASEWLSI